MNFFAAQSGASTQEKAYRIKLLIIRFNRTTDYIHLSIYIRRIVSILRPR